MQRAMLALVMGSAASMVAAMPATATDYPYCMTGGDFGRGDCSFSSYQQCQAAASGRDASCAENPYFNAKAETPADRRRPSRRRF